MLLLLSKRLTEQHLRRKTASPNKLQNESVLADTMKKRKVARNYSLHILNAVDSDNTRFRLVIRYNFVMVFG